MPLGCRTNLHHRWHSVSTGDGTARFRECRHCGKEAGAAGHLIPPVI